MILSIYIKHKYVFFPDVHHKDDMPLLISVRLTIFLQIHLCNLCRRLHCTRAFRKRRSDSHGTVVQRRTLRRYHMLYRAGPSESLPATQVEAEATGSSLGRMPSKSSFLTLVAGASMAPLGKGRRRGGTACHDETLAGSTLGCNLSPKGREGVEDNEGRHAVSLRLWFILRLSWLHVCQHTCKLDHTR